MLTAIETTATIGPNRQLLLDDDLPESAAAKVRVIVFFDDDDFSETDWLKAASKNDVLDFLNDESEDIYTLEDGRLLAKYKIVLVPFPFDDLSSQKVPPAVCLTSEIDPFGHIVLAFITSRVASKPPITDFVVKADEADFEVTGLKVSSTFRIHRLMTVSKSIIQRELGELSARHKVEIENRLRRLFEM